MKANRLRIYRFSELILWLGVGFFYLHCFDAWLTIEGIGMGGRELNPLLAWMSLGWMIAVKMLVVLGITVWVLWKRKRGIAIYGCVAVIGVLFWNLYRISQAMQ